MSIPDASALIQHDFSNFEDDNFESFENSNFDNSYDFDSSHLSASLDGGDEEHTIGRQVYVDPIENTTGVQPIVEPMMKHQNSNQNSIPPNSKSYAKFYPAYHFPTCYNNDNGSAVCNIPVISIFVCFFISIALISICGNFLVLYVVYKNSRMHRPPAVFKASLALADLLLSVLVIPSLVYNLIDIILSKHKSGIPDFESIQDSISAQMPYWIQVLVGSATFISVTASILTLLVMSIDRLVATRWPIYHRIHNSCTRAIISITMVWMVSIIPTILINIYPNIKFSISPYTFTYGPMYKTSQNSETSENSTSSDIKTASEIASESLQNIQTFGILYSAVCWALPWLVTTCLTMGVGVYGWKGLRSIRTMGGKSSKYGKSHNKPTLTQKISDTSTSSYDHIPVQKMDKKCVLKTKIGNPAKVSNSVRFDQDHIQPIKTTTPKPVVSKSKPKRSNATDSKNEDSSRRLVKTLCILVSMYTICVLPLTIMQLYTWSTINLDTSTFWQHLTGDSFRWIWFISSCLFLLQSTFNIFIYHQSREFSEGLKNVFKKDTKRGMNDSSFFTSSRMGTARSKNYSRFKRRKLMPNVTMSTSEGPGMSVVAGMNGMNGMNQILPFNKDTRYNIMNSNTDSSENMRYNNKMTVPVILDNIEKMSNFEEEPASVSSAGTGTTVTSEKFIISEKQSKKSNITFIGKCVMEPVIITESLDKLQGLKPINSLMSMNSLNSVHTLRPMGSLKKIVNLNSIHRLNQSMKLELDLDTDYNNSSGFEPEHCPEQIEQNIDIIRTMSTISVLPTRLLPTQGVDLMINHVAMPPIAVVTGDSGMDTISTNSSDIV